MDDFNNLLEILKKEALTIILLLIIVIMLFILDPIFGTIGAIIAIAIMYERIIDVNKSKKERIKEIEELNEDFESASQDVIFNMPFPLIMTDEEGIITWYNPNFLRLIEGESFVGQHIDEIIDGFDFENDKDSEERLEYTINDTIFILFTNKVEKSEGHSLYIFYFVDNTKQEKVIDRYEKTKVAFGHIYIDNYDELSIGRNSNDKGRLKSVIMAEIDSEIMDYFSSYGGIVRKYDDEKYLAVFNRIGLDAMELDKFSILDTIRNMSKEEGQTITLSMGISNTLDDLQMAYDESRSAVDLALSRGGDQAVLITDTGQKFFGGTSQAKEKRNRVRARVIGSSLKNLILQHDPIFIMGHKNADMDSIGSAIAVLGVVRRLGKKGYIVLNDINPSIEIIMETFKEVQPETAQYVISSQKAFELADKIDSMIILVDNHSRKSAEESDLFDYVETVVIIDHHRVTSGAIKDPVLYYIEPYASSTAELITEILEFIEPEMNLTNFEAEALMAGIVVDTKNFTYQTGVRTFEAASTLRDNGADLANVNKYFDDDYETVKKRAEVIQNSRLVNNEIAIGILSEYSKSSVLIAAQAADELLSINGINASFVISQMEDYIHISGRSTGEISVQLIMEELGGGGHLVSAATQLHDVSIQEAENLLLAAIDNYYKEKEEIKDESNTN